LRTVEIEAAKDSGKAGFMTFAGLPADVRYKPISAN
jgi:hypothetical protein